HRLSVQRHPSAHVTNDPTHRGPYPLSLHDALPISAAETIHLCIAIVRYAMDLEGWSNRLKVFADATRVRLLALLEGEELTVAELSAITQLAQPRVSTHLARLKEAGLVRDRRAGVSAYYRFDDAALDPAQRALWQTISHGSDDPLLRQDAERVPAVLAM